MKQVSILFFTVLIFSFQLTMAQGRRGGREKLSTEERAQRQTTFMKDSLNLTDEQLAVVQEVNLKYAKEREGLMQKDIPRQEKMYDMETLEIKREKELKKILDKEQFKKLKAMEERRRAKFRERLQERMRNDDNQNRRRSRTNKGTEG
ncbi:MAG: hypothetical protein AAGI07_13995 [Bacteroidota bacterium]